MKDGGQNSSLGEVARGFLSGLPASEREASQQEVMRFVRWYGWERPIDQLTIPEVANYAEHLVLSGADPLKKLEPVKTFLAYAKRRGLTKTNLGVHLRAKKGGPKPGIATRHVPQSSLTSEGYAELKAELASLKKERPQVIEELRKAAADKDFRENAPLEAAREYQGQLEGRIRALETTLESAVVQERPSANSKVKAGNTVILRDLALDEVIRYAVVYPSEVNPAKGRISIESPTGKALLGRGEGEEIKVTAPMGALRYRIEKIED